MLPRCQTAYTLAGLGVAPVASENGKWGCAGETLVVEQPESVRKRQAAELVCSAACRTTFKLRQHPRITCDRRYAVRRHHGIPRRRAIRHEVPNRVAPSRVRHRDYPQAAPHLRGTAGCLPCPGVRYCRRRVPIVHGLDFHCRTRGRLRREICRHRHSQSDGCPSRGYSHSPPTGPCPRRSRYKNNLSRNIPWERTDTVHIRSSRTNRWAGRQC